MPRANPKAYFPGSTGRISYRKVDKIAQSWRQHRPYFDTWGEAHVFVVTSAEQALKKAQIQLNIAIKHHLKVTAMKEPK